MIVYTPQEYDMSEMENCLCGDKGRNRNERECARRGGCRGCGFDRKEHQRRLEILRNQGVSPVSAARRTELLHKFSVNPTWELYGLRVGKKRSAKSEG